MSAGTGISLPWQTLSGNYPQPPINGQIVTAFLPQVQDVRWDDPTLLTANTTFTVLGVNIYRSDVSDLGPYHRLNPYPLGGTYYRDQTNIQPVVNEVVDWNTSWIDRGDASNNRAYVFKTKNPCTKPQQYAPYSRATPANAPSDVQVTVDGFVVEVDNVFGPTGEITLVNEPSIDPVTQKFNDLHLPNANSTVLVSYYTADTNQVRSGLDTKLFYRITTVAIDPQDPTNLIETPLHLCQPFSNIAIETLDYIWREAIRRNAWILQQGGERVKVFVRKQSGIPCYHGLDPREVEYSGQASQRCHICFAPGTLVRTSTGYMPIERIQVGDTVLASDGTYRSVIHTFENPFDGELVSILPSVAARPILATPEHPFLVLRGEHSLQRPCGPKCDKNILHGNGLTRSTGSVRLLPSGKWWARVQHGGARGKGRKPLGTFNTKEEAEAAIEAYLQQVRKPDHVLAWDDGCNIRQNDWLVPRWDNTVQDVLRISIPSEFLKNTHLGEPRLGPDFFDVDEDFLWMVGMYLAEGSSGTRGITFSLHAKESQYHERLLTLFRRWGYQPKLRFPKGESAVVSISSSNLASWFPVWLGRGCANKKIPEEFMRLPERKARALIQGVYDGDGSKRELEITQTSEVLALQLVELLHRVGESPLIRQQVARTLTPKGNARRVAFAVNWAGDALGRKNRKGRWVFQDHNLSQVRKTDRIPYSGPVYNLEVEGLHTYVVQGVVTHNCYGTGFVGGYEGPYETLIGPEDAERKIAQTLQGRRMENTYEVWTGPSPLLTQRDFLVKQTNERYSIGAVRRPSNRGNVMQQHFSIGYLDEGDIRYKFPIEGVAELPWPQTRYIYDPTTPYPVIGTTYNPVQEGDRIVTPMETNKGENEGGAAPYRQQRGKTVTWENQNYGFWIVAAPLAGLLAQAIERFA